MLRTTRTHHLARLLSIAAALTFAPLTVAGEIHVWPGESIQDAITAATDGDEVIVHQGEYFENMMSLQGKAITLRSEDPTDPGVVINTILNAGGGEGPIWCTEGETADTVISGFVFTGGFADLFAGGMYIDGSSPTVSHCTFQDNASEIDSLPGAILIQSGAPTVTHCTFLRNSGLAGQSEGGAIGVIQADPTIAHCTFIENTARYGAAIACYSSNAIITDCRFIRNGDGNAIGTLRVVSGDPTVSGCEFIENHAVRGGGLDINVSDATVTGCSFIGNTADVSGGGIWCHDSANPTIEHSSICANTPDQIVGPYTDGGDNVIGIYAPPPAEAPSDDCPEDVNGDDVIDVLDLLAVLASWGPCP